MKLQKKKELMKAYRDFYGGDLIVSPQEIDAATSDEELKEMIERHRTFMESVLCDAHSHIDNFKRRLFPL